MPSSQMGHDQISKIYGPLYGLEAFFLLLNVYYFCYGFFAGIGMTSSVSDGLLDSLSLMGFFDTQYTLKWYTLGVMIITNMIRHEECTKTSWAAIIIIFVAGMLLFFTPFTNKGAVMYMITTIFGFAFTHLGISLFVRKTSGADPDLNDEDETFAQNRKKCKTIYSINIPFRYQYKHRKWKGYIPVPVPFAGCMIMGLPGSGKSYSIYTPFIEQMISKCYTLFVYDYKFPELSIQTYNEYLLHKDDYLNRYGKVPEFCVVNYNDPRYSMRVNPLHPRYIKNPSDSTEISDLIIKNADPGARTSSGGDQFWTNSAKTYIDCIIWRLRVEQGGRYCTFPHLIEMMGRNYKYVFKWLMQDEETKVKARFFVDVLKGGAMETLSSQIASARAPLMRFASKDLYWVLSGDDFSLDINDPNNPKILCVGNDPKKQTIYGTTNALITMRLFTQINTPKKLPCGCLLDEFPTIIVDGLANLVATARSRLVAVVIGIQDFQQLVISYTMEQAEAIWDLMSNIFAGRVNGKTAEKISNIAGKEYREQRSHTSSGSGNSTSTSQHLVDMLPAARISNLSQGFFAGKIADGKVGKAKNVKVKKKVFCGEIMIDGEHFKAVTENGQPIPPVGEKYFDLKGIQAEAKAKSKETIISYLENVIREKEVEDSLKSENYIFSEPSYVERKAREQYEAMTDEEKEDALKKAINELELKKVNEVLKKNYYKIKQDIDDIFKANKIEVESDEDEIENADNNDDDTDDDE